MIRNVNRNESEFEKSVKKIKSLPFFQKNKLEKGYFDFN